MLFLLFELGQDRYALEAGAIVEVLPLVDVKRIPRAPPGVAGLFMYRGAPVPLIDLTEIALGRPATNRLSTRIVVVNYSDESGQTHLLGLIAERASETMRRDRSDFIASGIANEAAPYLGPVTRDSRGVVQWIDVNQLLPEQVHKLLFTRLAASA